MSRDESLDPDLGPTREIVVKGVFWTSSFTFISKLVRSVSTIVLARLLVPRDFGSFYLAYSAISLFQLLRLPMKQAIIQRLDETDDRQRRMDIAGTALTLKITFGVAVFLFALASFRLLASRLDLGESLQLPQVLSILILSSGFTEFPRHLLNWRMMFKSEGVADVVKSISYTMISIFLALIGFGVWSLVYAEIISEIVAAVLAWVLARTLVVRPSLNLEEARIILRFAIVSFGSSILSWITSQGDRLILGLICGEETLGYYGLALSIVLIPLRAIGYLNRVIFPTLTKLQREKNRMKTALESILQYFLLFTFPAAVGIFTLARPLISVIYTNKWLPAEPIIRLLVALPVLGSVMLVLNSFFYAVGKPGIVFQVILVRSLSFTILALPLAPQFGVQGVALAVLVSSALGVAMGLRIVRRRVRPRFKFLKPMISAIGMGAILYLLEREVFDFMTLATAITFGGITYLLILRVLQGPKVFEELWGMAGIFFGEEDRVAPTE